MQTSLQSQSIPAHCCFQCLKCLPETRFVLSSSVPVNLSSVQCSLALYLQWLAISSFMTKKYTKIQDQGSGAQSMSRFEFWASIPSCVFLKKSCYPCLTTRFSLLIWKTGDKAKVPLRIELDSTSSTQHMTMFTKLLVSEIGLAWASSGEESQSDFEIGSCAL